MGNKPRKKRAKHGEQTKVLGVTKRRLAGMTEINPKLDLGGGVSVASLTKGQDELQALMAKEDSLETQLVNVRIQIKDQTATMRDLNERALSSVLGKYGSNSGAYKQVGGTRRSERKKPVRKPKQQAEGGTTPPQPQAPAPAPSAPAEPAAAPAALAATAPPNGAAAPPTNGHTR